MASLLERLKGNSTIEMTDTLGDSVVFSDISFAPTGIPMLNVALSGELGGGLAAGVTQFAGPSKHFKTLFGLILVKAYLDANKDAMVLFYDSEFGAGWQYFDNLKIPRNRVLHTPITNLEELKHDIAVQLKEIKRGDKVIIFVDSIGNLASLKEATDAEDGKTVADMTRAKQMKSLFRIITPQLVLKDIPMVAINHTYKTQEMYSKDVVSGGTGAYYSSQQIFIIGRQQEKGKGEDDKKVIGYNFVINVEKSRFVKEKSKIIVNVTFEQGVNTWSGLLEVAQDGGFVTKPGKGKYSVKGSRKEWKEDETNSKEFWSPILTNPEFQQYIKDTFKLANTNLVNSELTDDDVAAEYDAAKTEAPAAEEEIEEKPRRKRSLREAANEESESTKAPRRKRRKKKNA